MVKLEESEVYLAAKELRSNHTVKKKLKWPLTFRLDLKLKATEIIRRHNLVYSENIALVMSAIAKKCWEQIKEEKKTAEQLELKLGDPS